MFKKAIIASVSLFIFSASFVLNSHASVHGEIPAYDDTVSYDLSYYEDKQNRCLQAFSQSEFDVAYAICTPLANLGFKDAQLVTGLLYAFGEGVDKDLYRAKVWLKEALKNGREDAAQALADFDLN